MPDSHKPNDDGDDQVADAWSRAPRTAQDELVSRAPTRAVPEPSGGPVAQGTALARELAGAFRAHVRRALNMSLDDSETSLAFVDHYLRTVRSETRAPIVALIAAEAGAYYGELVCATIGGTWIGDGREPRRLRLMVRHQFLHFSPVDQALEVVLGQRVQDEDLEAFSQEAGSTSLDTLFHARSNKTPSEHQLPATHDDNAEPAVDLASPDDASWLAQRLAELPPVGEDEYYTLTCRFETLKLVLELLATKHAAEGKSPREYEIADYVEALASRG